jgi:hypothetical protein
VSPFSSRNAKLVSQYIDRTYIMCKSLKDMTATDGHYSLGIYQYWRNLTTLALMSSTQAHRGNKTSETRESIYTKKDGFQTSRLSTRG